MLVPRSRHRGVIVPGLDAEVTTVAFGSEHAWSGACPAQSSRPSRAWRPGIERHRWRRSQVSKKFTLNLQASSRSAGFTAQWRP
jgi:hypothetical protein